MKVELVEVTAKDKSVLANLIQLYLHDFSEIRNEELTEHGTFTYPYLDHYFVEEKREAHFIKVAGKLAGFALTRGDVYQDGSWNVAEFFVARRYRAQGIGSQAVRLLFACHPGEWTLTFDRNNEAARKFWPTVVQRLAQGAVAATDKQPSETSPAITELRFRVPS